MKQERSGKRAGGDGGRGRAGWEIFPLGAAWQGVGAVRGADRNSTARTSPGCHLYCRQRGGEGLGRGQREESPPEQSSSSSSPARSIRS